MKHYLIAGLRVAMDSFGRTVEQASVYEVPQEGEPDITIRSNPEELHSRCPYLSLEDCEYLSSGGSFYTQLLNYNGMVLHSSCVVVDDRAYLFTADCGTGKSTHTKLWLKTFGDRAYILNDDKPALREENGVWYAYGTPWSGKFDISRNVRVPIAGIALLERGDKNEIAPHSGVSAIQFILGQVTRPNSAAYRMRVLDTLDSLMQKVPVWKLKCNIEPEAALVSYNAMSGLNKEN